MPVQLTSLRDPIWAGFDTVIDVRAPSEYAQDHIPGALNMPVLDDAERAKVGTIYTQESPFAARKIGAALVARNAARAIEAHMLDRPGDWRPFVYCWRGGQRSGSFAEILRQVGWRVETLQGGYQSYRRAVVAALYDSELEQPMYRLDGLTGTGKTALLGVLKDLGVQVIDLEGLACHRGSALGDMAVGQPAQKGFESWLMAEIAALDPSRPVVLEAESGRIGALRLPPALWAAMRGAPRLMVEVPVPARARFLAQSYRDLFADPTGLMARLDMLKVQVGAERLGQWEQMIAQGRAEDLAQDLITQHYDPAYARQQTRDTAPVVARFQATTLTQAAQQELARKIADWVAASKGSA